MSSLTCTTAAAEFAADSRCGLRVARTFFFAAQRAGCSHVFQWALIRSLVDGRSYVLTRLTGVTRDVLESIL